MNLDKDKILQIAEELSKKENHDTSELFEALGGKALYEVFDEYTVSKIIENLIETGKVHHYLPGSGLDAIEGLLNKQIVGNLGKFYNIKPEYILSLSLEQRKEMARALSEGRKDLERLLMASWEQGILTLDCGGESQSAYFSIKVPINDTEKIAKMQNVSEEFGYPVNINKFENMLDISIYGEPDSLYECLLVELEKNDSRHEFLDALIEAIESEKELVSLKTQVGYTDEQVEALLEDNSKQYVEEIHRLEAEVQSEKAKYSELRERFARVRFFIVNKIGKIPFLGKSVLNLLQKDLGQNELSDKNGERDK